MRSVKVEEFCERPAEFLENGESLWIERDGERIGYFVPVQNGRATNGRVEFPRKDTPEAREALERLERTLQAIYAETGLTEDEFANLMDPSKPFPYDDPSRG
jgi:hypothetical protein